MIRMRFGNADFDYRPATGLEKPVLDSKANSAIDEEGDTGEFEAIPPKVATTASQADFHALIEACTEEGIALIHFPQTEGTLLPETLRNAANAALATPKKIILLDLSGIKQFGEDATSETIGVLANFLIKAKNKEVAVFVVGMSKEVKEKVTPTKINKLYKEYPDAASAMAAIKSISTTDPPPTPSDHP